MKKNFKHSEINKKKKKSRSFSVQFSVCCLTSDTVKEFKRIKKN